jgi:hypothetical protein
MCAIRPGFPVVLYTGYFDGPSAEELEAACIGGKVVIKPATRKELTDVIREALRGGRQRAGARPVISKGSLFTGVV